MTSPKIKELRENYPLIKVDIRPYTIKVDLPDFRLKKKKDGSYILQRAVEVREYDKGVFQWAHIEWKDIETVEEE
ncbi:MAG: hypothetical protein J6S85_02955 [Methanobrevibacter sp.]|nr:hypothetical protein [Methanobrevibacter sp.]